MSETVLHLGDCLAVMRGMPAESVDAIVTDPPYGQSNEAYDKGVVPAVWVECFRVAKPNAALLSFAGGPTYHRIASGIEAAGWKVRQMWAWVYKDGLITSAWPKEGFDRLAPAMDPICFATKGKVLLNLEREGDYWAATRTKNCLSERSAKYGGNGTTSAEGHWPRSIIADDMPGWEYFAQARTNGHRHERVGHPNQKPLVLMRWLLGKLPPGGIVLDPYAGSATTLIAAIGLGMDAIGIEADPGYHAIAARRIDEARAATPLFADTVQGAQP